MVTLKSTNSLRLIAVLSVSTSLAACSLNGHNRRDATVIEPEVVQHQADLEAGADNYTTSLSGNSIGLDGSMIADGAPNEHVVVKGDTLWDISGKFLKEPWLWPQIWSMNPQIRNPHLIYPGDIIALEYRDGQPHLRMSREGSLGMDDVVSMTLASGGSAGIGGTERLSPRIRSQSLEEAIPTIPGDAIQQFLVYPRVVPAAEISRAPYVVGNYDGRLASATDHQIYVRGNVRPELTTYGIFRQNKAIRDPSTNELLGYEVAHVATAKLMKHGDPSTLLITANKAETLNGDRLMPLNQQHFVHNYIPRIPQLDGEGQIVSLIDALTRTGRNQVVVLNLGERSGIKVGDVLAIERRGGTFVDEVARNGKQILDLPNTRTGVVMVFQTFDKVSYALVMESTRPIRIHDVVTGI